MGDQIGPVVHDPAAHDLQLRPPGGPQPVVLQDRGHHGRAVLGRHRVERPGGVLQGGLGVPDGLARGAEHDGAADAVAVEAEVLRAADGDQHFRHPRRQHPRGQQIGLQAVAETVVGEVDEGHPAPAGGRLGERLPVVQQRVHARGVVAAALEQDHVVPLRFLQFPQHTGRVEAALGVAPAVRAHAQPGGLQDGPVVDVGRIADPHRGARAGPADQVGQQPQRAGARDGLDGRGPVGGPGRTQDQLQQGAIEGRVAGEPAVLLGLGALGQADLGLAHGGHDGCGARLVPVDAEDEVEAFGSLVTAELVGQVPQRVGGRRGEELKHLREPWVVGGGWRGRRRR